MTTETSQTTDTGGLARDNLTVRDYFAAAAMQGLVAQSNGTAFGSGTEGVSDYAYGMADAMMKGHAK